MGDPMGVRVEVHVPKGEEEISGDRVPVEDTEGEGVEDLVMGADPD